MTHDSDPCDDPWGTGDPALRAMLNDLHAQYRVPVPVERLDRVVAAAMRGRYPGSKRGGSWRRKVLAPAAVLLASVALVAAASHRLSLVDVALELGPATQQIGLQHLGQPEHLSRTKSGFTLTIDRVYAGAHMVVVGYIVRGPSGQALRSLQPFGVSGRQAQMPVLSDGRGREIPGIGNSWSTGVESGAEAGVLVYRLGHPVGRTTRLHLTVEAISALRVSAATGSVRVVVVPGPFKFALAVGDRG